jgi:hypothetical protein
MALNQTWRKEIVDGKEKMILVESIEVPDPPPSLPTIEEVVEVLKEMVTEQEKQINELKAKAAANATEIEKLKEKR